MDINKIAFLSVAEQARLIQKKEVTPTELVQAYLDRIEQVDTKLNSYITVLADDALRDAEKATADIAVGNYIGTLHGIPVGIKDQIHTRGIRTSSGSKHRENFVPEADATVVANLKKAGAIVLGKLNMTEFAFGDPITSAFGVTRNPWDLERNPGTSSTGSGAATAACLCSTALGEDTGGSVRGPAANCGLTGIRPSWGRVSRFGVDGASWSFDTIGPLSRTVEDCAITLGAIAGHDPNDPYTWETPVPDYRSHLTGDIRGVKVGLVKELVNADSGVSDAVKSAVLKAADVMRRLGADVTEVSLPLASVSGVAMRVLTSVERVSLNPSMVRERPQDFHPNIRVGFMTGEIIPAQAYYKAQKTRALVRRQVLEAFETYDVLIQPTSSSPAGVMDLTPGIRSQEAAANVLKEGNFRGLYSCAGNPALSTCCGFTEGEKPLPLALQIAARPFDEATALKVAHAYEQATDWHKRFPPV
ncbi:MAG: Asp-tRNA(Asn)/Glu-tRNA(Gln) amidotransferase GatCAB subunit A [Chloroflexi bacterium]|nr:Asp-tRNA(Asn)/Glu-tRNA(Gln) amidotransferase GatCAB subunit A [Chloroflexota bacterium]